MGYTGGGGKREVIDWEGPEEVIIGIIALVITFFIFLGLTRSDYFNSIYSEGCNILVFLVYGLVWFILRYFIKLRKVNNEENNTDF